MRRSMALVLASLSACVLPSLDGLSGGATDGGATADAAKDGGTDAVEGGAKICDMAAPFTSVQVSTVNTSDEEFDASLSPDEREIWFARGSDLFHASRAKRDDPFGTAIPVPVNTSAQEGDPWISADLLTLLFIRTPSTAGSWDIFISTRTSTATDFGTSKLIAGVVSSGEDVFPSLTADGKHLYFASDVGGNMDTYVATASGADFGNAQKIPELSSSSTELGSIITADELDIYVASYRPDGGAKGNADIFRASRATKTGTFGPLTNVAELNTTFDERVTWLSPDHCRVYIDTKRPGGPGGRDIYVAERFPK